MFYFIAMNLLSKGDHVQSWVKPSGMSEGRQTNPGPRDLGVREGLRQHRKKLQLWCLCVSPHHKIWLPHCHCLMCQNPDHDEIKACKILPHTRMILEHGCLLIWVDSTFPAEEAMAPHSSTLAWKIPWMEEPGRLQSMGSLRVRHHWATSLSLFTFMHWRRKWQPTPVFLPGESQDWGSLVCCRLWGRTELDTTEVT